MKKSDLAVKFFLKYIRRPIERITCRKFSYDYSRNIPPIGVYFYLGVLFMANRKLIGRNIQGIIEKNLENGARYLSVDIVKSYMAVDKEARQRDLLAKDRIKRNLLGEGIIKTEERVNPREELERAKRDAYITENLRERLYKKHKKI